MKKGMGKKVRCMLVEEGMVGKKELKKVLEEYEWVGVKVMGVDGREKLL